MVRVILKKENELLNEIEFKGHALFANTGKDIVCAGISSILTTSVNAMIRFDSDSVSYIQNDDKFTLYIHKDDKITNVLIENMLSLLKELEVTYSKNIKVEEES